MKTIRLLLLVALVAFCPARAYALEGWWDWLDALSGPGPYWGIPGVGQTLFCVRGPDNDVEVLCWREDQYHPGNPDKRPLKQSLEARVSRLNNFDGLRFQDDPDERSVNVFSFEVFYLFRVNRDFQIDAGPGVGLLRFSGDDFEPIYRFAFSPLSVSFAPFRKADSWVARALRLRLESLYVPEGFTGDQFDNRTTSFRTTGEFLTRMAIVFRY